MADIPGPNKRGPSKTLPPGKNNSVDEFSKYRAAASGGKPPLSAEEYERLKQSLRRSATRGYICYVDAEVMAPDITQFLGRQGYVVDHYTNTAAALQSMQSSKFDLVLINCQSVYANVSGSDFIIHLRSLHEQEKRNTPIIAMYTNTGARGQQDIDDVNDHLYLPVNQQQLLLAIDKQLQLRGERPGKLAQKTVTGGSKEYVGKRGAVIREVNPQRKEALKNASTQMHASIPGVALPTDAVFCAETNTVNKSLASSAETPLLEQMIGWVGDWPKVIVVLSLLLTLLAAAGLHKFQFNDDYKIYFGEDNPQLRAFQSIERIYTENNFVLLVVAPKDGNVFTRNNLVIVESLTRDALHKIPYNSRVDSLSNFQFSHAEDDDLIVGNLVDDAKHMSASQIARVKKFALEDDQLVNRLISPNGAVTAINVNVLLPGKTPEQNMELGKAARGLLQEYRDKYPQVEFYLTGSAMLDNAFAEAAEKDMATLLPLMLVVVLLVSWLFLRSVIAVAGVTMVIIMASLTAMGAASWLGMQWSSPSISAPIIILTLAVADSIHVLESLFFHMNMGRSKKEAIVEALRVNMTSILFTSLTTVIGFLSMNSSDAPPFRDLGNVVAFGVAMAFVYSVTFLPAFMLLVKFKYSAANAIHLPLEALGKWVVRNGNNLFWAILLITIVLAAGISRITVDDVFVNYFDESFEFRRHSDFVNQNLTGIDNISFSVNSGLKDGIYEPEYLQRVEQFADWLRLRPEVMHVSTVSDIMKRLNKNMHGDNIVENRLPEQRAEAAQYMLLYEMSLPSGLELTNQINLDKSATLVTATLKQTSTQDMLTLERDAEYWLQSNMPKYAVETGSPSVMFAHIAERNIVSMINGTVVSIILISLSMILVLRNVKLGILSLIPNIVPALMAFGLWGWFVGEVGLAVSVVASISLGIVVDDTVHFMTKYNYARRHYGLTVDQALPYAMKTVGHAALAMSAVLMAGFLILGMSGFAVNADMGLLTAVIIALALLTDFFLLPVLLLKAEKHKLSSTNSGV